jgi:hypothetical protein
MISATKVLIGVTGSRVETLPEHDKNVPDI